MSIQYVLRVHQPDGSWKFELDNPMSQRVAERVARVNRLGGGMVCQIWTEKEAAQLLASAIKGGAPGALASA